MPIFLVIAHQTAHSPELIKALKEKQQADASSEFVLLVPVTRYEDLKMVEDGSLRDVARRAATAASEALTGNGIHLRWTVISEFTAAAALDTELKDHPREYDGIILSTFPEGISRWLDDHLLTAAESRGLPVTQVITERESIH